MLRDTTRAIGPFSIIETMMSPTAPTTRIPKMPISITEERPDTPDAKALIEELEAHLATLYARESRHGFSVEKLLRERVEFFVSRDDCHAAGCGGGTVIGRGSSGGK